MIAALALLTAEAQAVDQNIQFCVSVDIAYVDDQAGDHWTNDGVDKPARGFYFQILEVGNGFIWGSGYLATSGANAGCTPVTQIPHGTQYRLYVESRGKIGTNDIEVYDDSTSPALATHLGATWYAWADITRNLVLPGLTDDRWNHLAAIAFALNQHDGGLTNRTFVVYEEACSGGGYCAKELATDESIRLDGADRKFIVTHELGHLVSYFVDEGGRGCDNATLDTGSLGGCVGDDSPGKHGQLTKAYQSMAGCEGMADFYSAMTWNQLSPGGAQDCGYIRQHNLDWDEDGDFESGLLDAHDCAGETCAACNGTANPDGIDWLEDMATQTDGGTDGECQGTLENRSTQYDWLTYFWAMVTLEAVPIPHVFDIWDAADPHSWNPGDTGDTGDFPIVRMEDAADATPAGCFGGTCYGTEHDQSKRRGLDH